MSQSAVRKRRQRVHLQACFVHLLLLLRHPASVPFTAKILLCCEDPLGLSADHNKDAADGGEDRPKRRRTGPYRAFVHCQQRRRRLDAEAMRQLSADYHALTEEEKQVYVNMGSSVSSLPACSTRAKRQREGHASAPKNPSLHLTGGLPFRQMLDDFLTDGCCAPPVSLPAYENPNALLQSLRDSRVWRSRDPEVVRRILGMALRAEKRAQREKDKELYERVFQDVPHRTRQLLRTRQRLEELDVEWLCLPHSCDQLVAKFSAERMVKEQSFQDQNLHQLADSWQTKHTGIPRSSWTHCRDPGPGRHMRCYQQNFCICRGRGREVGYIEGKLNAFLRTCSEDPSLERALRHGGVVLHFQNKSVREGDEAAAENLNYFMHVPLMYLRPYRATLLELRLLATMPIADIPDLPSQTEAANPVDADGEPILLEVAPDEANKPPFKTCCDFLNSLNLDCAWFVQICLLSTRCRPVNRLGGVVFMMRTDHPSACIWHPDHRRRRGRQRPAVPPPEEGVDEERPLQPPDSEAEPEVYEPADLDEGMDSDGDDNDDDNEGDVLRAEAALAEAVGGG